jgi:hypothetical protein
MTTPKLAGLSLLTLGACAGPTKVSGTDAEPVVSTPAQKDAAAAVPPTSAADAAGVAADTGAPGTASDSRPASATPDAFFGAPRCSKASMLFCDDFESGAVNTQVWRWTHESATGAVEMPARTAAAPTAPTGAARGKYAFHVKISNVNANPWNYGTLATRMPFPIAGNKVFVRAFVFLERNTPNRHFGLLEALATQRSPSGAEWAYHLEFIEQSTTIGGGLLGYYQTWAYAKGEPSTQVGSRSDHVPVDRWACWEWELRGSSNELAVSVDGQAIPSMNVPATKNWLAPPNATIALWSYTSHVESLPPGGYSVWYDEIAVSNAPIGCTQ